MWSGKQVGGCVGISANSQLMRLQSGRPTSQALLYCWLVRPTTEIKNTSTNIISSASTNTIMYVRPKKQIHKEMQKYQQIVN